MKNKYKNNKKITVLTLAVLLLIAGGLGLWAIKHKNAEEPASNPGQGLSEDGIDYSPATQADKEENARVKARLSNEADAKNNSGHKSVKPDIASVYQTSSKIEVSARVPGVVEDGGTCTFTFTRDGISVSKKSTGVSNVSDTSCGFISVNKSQLSKGTWSLSVKYSSKNASGSSSPKPIEVK